MLETYLDSCPFAAARVATDGTILAASKPFADLLGYSLEEFVGLRYQEFTHPDDVGPDVAKHQALVAGDISSYGMMKRYRHVDGHYIHVRLEVGIDRATNNAWAWVQDITEDRKTVETAALFNAVTQAMQDNEFERHYQPIVDLATGHTVAFETLIRWPIGDYMRRPDEWLPKLTDDLIPALDAWMLFGTCQDRLNWLGEQAFAVNINPKSLKSASFVDQLKATPARVGVNPQDIWFEIVESSAILDEDWVKLIAELQALGHRVGVDDFGAGYSNLVALLVYGADIYKFDKSLINELTGPYCEAAQMIRAVVSLKGTKQFKTVAEGIETAEMAELARALGVDYGQGYLYNRAKPLKCFMPVVA